MTNFVHPGTPLDEEAASRGTSVYLVERRIDMLPKPLTEGIPFPFMYNLLGYGITSHSASFSFNSCFNSSLKYCNVVNSKWLLFCRYLLPSVWCGEASLFRYLGIYLLVFLFMLFGCLPFHFHVIWVFTFSFSCYLSNSIDVPLPPFCQFSLKSYLSFSVWMYSRQFFLFVISKQQSLMFLLNAFSSKYWLEVNFMLNSSRDVGCMHS